MGVPGVCRSASFGRGDSYVEAGDVLVAGVIEVHVYRRRSPMAPGSLPSWCTFAVESFVVA